MPSPSLNLERTNFLKMAFVAVLSLIFMIISTVVQSRLMSVADRGVYQLFVVQAVFFSVLGSGGLGFTLALKSAHNNLSNWCKYFSLIISITVCVAIISIFAFNVSVYPWMLVINTLGMAIYTNALEFLKTDPTLKYYRFLTLQATVLLTLMFTVTLVLFGMQPIDVIIWVFTIFSIVQTLICVYLLKLNAENRSSKPSKSLALKEFFPSFVRQTAYQIVIMLVGNLDKFLTAFFMGHYVLGLYAVFVAFDILVNKICIWLGDFYYSGLLAKIKRFKIVLFSWIVMLVLGMIFTPLLAHTIIDFAFGEDYQSTEPLLVWFVLNSLISGIAWIISQPLLLVGMQMYLLISQLVGALCLVLLFVFFANLGLQGVVIALIISNSIRFLCVLFLRFNALKFEILDKKH